MPDLRFSRRNRSDLWLGSAATQEHLCRLQLLDVIGHHFCRQCQIVNLFEAESKGLQTPYQQNQPEMRLSEDVETPSIPSMLIIAFPEIVTLSILPFLENTNQQIGLQMVSTMETVLCRHLATEPVPCQFPICSAGDPSFRGQSAWWPQFFRGTAVQQPYLSGKKGISKIFRPLKRFPTIVALVAA